MSLRKNITVSDSTAKWYEDKAKDMGLSQSAVMSIALQEYIKQDSALKTMSDIMVQMKRLQVQQLQED